MPAPLKSRQDILLRDIFYSGLIVILRVVSIYDTIDLILRLPQPILLQIMQYDFDP